MSTASLGRDGERRASEYLEALGYRVTARNLTTRRGELDIIGWDGDTLCFIEVKARSSTEFGGGQAAVNENKRARLWKAAEAYLATDEQLWASPPECRFDVVTVTIDHDRESRHWHCQLHRDAFVRRG